MDTKAEAERKLQMARILVQDAEAESRPMTPVERELAETWVTQAKALKAEVPSGDLIKTGRGSRDPFAAFKAAGWEGSGKRVAISPDSVFQKTATFAGDPDDLGPVRREGAPLGVDSRRIYTAFPRETLGAGDTSVTVLEQSSRTIAQPGSYVRDLFQDDEKESVDSERDLNTVTVKQVAAISKNNPNATIARPEFRNMVNVDLRLAIEQDLDFLTEQAIVAANVSGSPAGADLSHSLFDAVEFLALEGRSPDTVLISPADYSDLLLTQTAGPEEMYQRPPVPPGLRFHVSPLISDTAPYVLEAAAFGRLFLGAVSLAAFEEEAGATNTQLIRMEAPAIFVVDRVDAAVQIGVGS